MGTGLMTFMLPIHTFNDLVLIVWRKGQETMHNLRPVCGASYHGEIIKIKTVMKGKYSDAASKKHNY